MSERIAAVARDESTRRIGIASDRAIPFFLSGLSGASGAAAKGQAGGGSASLTPAQINANVDRLLGRMSVAEKFGQLEMAGPSTPTGSDLIPLAKQGKIGSVLDLTGVKNINAVQAAAVKHSRLHIPLIFGLDVIHGYRTMFPVPLGEAASWDPALMSKDESVSPDEASADGIKWTFNPMVDISRDPRWGRVVEGAGEDPFLGSAIAAAKVRGYQGTNFSAPNTTFSFSNLHAPGSVSANGTFNVTADITNSGSVAGTDVAQLYVHEDGTTILQPRLLPPQPDRAL